MKKKTLVSTIALLFTVSGPAFAGGGLTGGATLPEQIVQEGTAVEQLAKQVESVETQIAQYENMIQNMVTLPQSMIGQIVQPIDQLYGLVGQAESLSTNAQNIAQQFQNLNVSFNPQLTQQYVRHYQSITSGLQNAIDTALRTANLNPNNFATQAQAQQAIAQAMQNPSSRNAILQASVAVGQATTSDLNQLLATVKVEDDAEMDWKRAKLQQQVVDQHAVSGIADNFFQTGKVNPPQLSGNAFDDAFGPSS
jgi:P-type conjugative transfer protein TrbJ